MSNFVQIHFLTSFSGALLNRDDSGLAKRLPYGGSIRTRVSSQCLKRHWRVAGGGNALSGFKGANDSFRTKRLVSDLIRKPHEDAATDEVLAAAENLFIRKLYGERGVENRQSLLFGEPEIRFFSDLFGKVIGLAGQMIESGEVLEEEKKPRKAKKDDGDEDAKSIEGRAVEQAFASLCELGEIKSIMSHITGLEAQAGGLAAALFGRMVTSDRAANIEAPIHVAHAFTVHAEESEADYFTAIDDLALPDETAANHIGETELTSGLYYGYVVIDIAGLVSNLTGVARDDWREADLELAAEVVRRLVHQIAEVSPGAKKGSTAPYGYAQTLLVEAGDRQPRSLASAFRAPVRANLEAADEAMTGHLARLDEVYGSDEERRFLAIRNATEFPRAERDSLSGVADWAAGMVRGAGTAT